MKDLVMLVLSVFALTFALALPVSAQDDSVAFAVTYIEVTPSSTENTIDLLRAQAQASRDAAGNLRFQILQRIGRPHHFAILDAWASQDARERNTVATHTEAFRTALEPLLYSPYDERPSNAVMGTSAAGGDGQIYTVTHVDFAPPALEAGLEFVDAYLTASRQVLGAVDIGVIVQNNRRNHMTLFETWASAEHRLAHAASEAAVQYRSGIHPGMGALYDERVYRRL